MPALPAALSRIDTGRRNGQASTAQPVSANSLDLSPDSEAWSPTQPSTRPRKSRREKPRIELAPDQPPTTQGKPRARVYVACVQCRTRKIRCDGAKPICHNCGKRANGSVDCNYDPLPKRRGPDKRPGARQRVARKMNGEPSTRSRRAASSSQDYPPDNTGTQLPPFSFPSPTSSGEHTDSPELEYVTSPHDPRMPGSYMSTCACHGLAHCPSPRLQGGSLPLLDHVAPGPQISVPYDDSINVLSPSPVETFCAYVTEYNDDGEELPRKDVVTIASQPSLDFSQKIWWDSLLSLYLSPTSNRLEILSANQRDLATRRITSDLRFLFRASNYWFSFFHAPTFFSRLCDSSKRQFIQPSLILASLSMSTFWQSSEVGLGHHGRQRALIFRDEAQSALEASFNAGWVDETLAQAAWLLAMFEICSHPHHTTERAASSMMMLDRIIRSLSLTMVDRNDPYTSKFAPGEVPAITSPSSPTAHSHRDSLSYALQYPIQSPLPVSNDRGCSCRSLTLGEQWMPAFEHTPFWAQTPAWSAAWSDSEIRKESCRRLCWSSMILAACHTAYTAANHTNSINLFISDPANYALFFSGEAMVHSPAAKDTVWALYDRSFLLWSACITMRGDTSGPIAEKRQFAMRAWLEADAIEEALNRHTCGIEKAFIYHGREYIFNTRLCISFDFQRFVPLVSTNGLFREKAEDWCTHQACVAQQFMAGLDTITGNSGNTLAKRPFFVFWFMAQVSRGITLWQCDNTMSIALDVCKKLLAPIDYLTALWPCQEQRMRYESLRERLRDACEFAGLAPLPPLNLTLPTPTSIDEFM
ncbi:hypothetical protein FB45DRAFT_736166 [Roridomyces roridus]|uniref:Zn(2)-C6 fungal-type domain-containing protein n=1 Tax=Roridomyces roridus TaxID=1738132 RepID=A0AAD7CAZ8_9AGAR|nr:hypothetical protein FB45DRAFT_736166 [Roridomyces roridus]